MRKIFISIGITIMFATLLTGCGNEDVTPPVINAENMVIKIGDIYNPLFDFTAVDTADGDLELVIEDSNVPNSLTDGIYYITYSATDFSGNKSSKTISVTIDRAKPLISIVPNMLYSFIIGDELPEWTNYFTVEDNVDGEIEVTNELINSNVDMNKAGFYVVSIIVSDYSNNESKRELVIEVKDVTNPEIWLTSSSVLFEVGDNAFTEQDWRNFILSVSDDVDNLEKSDVLVEYNSIDYDLVGNYTVSYILTDLSGNITIKTIKVEITDSILPILILSNTSITIERGTVISEAFFKTFIVSATDNVDGDLLDNVEVFYADVKNDISGTYDILYAITDSSNNITLKEISVIVEDTTIPNILSFDDTNETGYYILSSDEKIAEISYDNGETWNDVSIEAFNLEITFYLLGEYKIKIKDDSGNQNELYVLYSYVDTTVPTFDIILDQTIEAGVSDIDFTTLITNEADNSDGTLTKVEVEDNVDYDTPGTYTVIVKVVDESLNETSQTFNVTVEDTTAPTITSINETNTTGDYTINSNEKIAWYSLDNGVSWVELVIPSMSFAIPNQPVGTYTIHIRDISGNDSSNFITLTVNS